MVQEIHQPTGVDLVRDTKPLKITFPGSQFFPGLEGKNEAIGMVKAHIRRTAGKSLVSYCVLFTVLALPFFRHDSLL